MINPSANGWVDKYFSETHQHGNLRVSGTTDYYLSVRRTGFIFGHPVSVSYAENPELGWKREEITKLALLEALYGIYLLEAKNSSREDFVNQAVMFYNSINPKGSSIFRGIFSSRPSQLLEEILHARVQTNQDVITRNFSQILTNALLFVDVLAFKQFLDHDERRDQYLKQAEEAIIGITSLALKAKAEKSVHDDMLIRLFESSVRYGKFVKRGDVKLEDLNLSGFQSDLEKFYFIDLAGMTMWRDEKMESGEIYFLQKLAERMNVPDQFVLQSITETNEFIRKHRREIPFFNLSHPVRNFYDNVTLSVITLIRRNRKRLIREISQSRELMVLLAASTHRDLNKQEKRKVKSQLLDICKSVPSLTIFLLPGGSLLLPILIKFIPQLLPSAFNENIEKY